MGSAVSFSSSSRQVFRFGQFEVDAARNTLTRNGVRVKIQDQPFRVLLFLLERPNEIVTRDELRQKLWPEGTYVDFDGSLNVVLKKLRAALDDDSENPRFIETVPRRGYRFIAPVSPMLPTAEPGTSAVEAAPTSRWWRWAALACVVAIAASIGWMAMQSRRPAKAMLIVLPLQNLSGDPQQDYLVDGITEEILTELGSLDPHHLGVIARTSSMQYKNGKKDVAQISRELGVGYVLEGSVRRDGNRVRVTAQLIQASDQTHLWAQSYDREIGDVLRLETDIAVEIAGQIRLAVSGNTQKRLATVATVNPEAHDAYLRGLQGWNQRNREGFLQAIREFSRATEIDPKYAPAYAQLARVYSLSPIFAGIPASEAAPMALEAANHALSLDETLADAHTALAFAKVHYLHDWNFAERDFRRAIELEPNNPYGHFFYSNSVLSPSGRHDDAIAEMKKAIELDPLSTRIQSFAGRTYIYARRYDDAVTQFKRVNQMDAKFALNRERLADLYALLGKYADAIDEGSIARKLSGEDDAKVVEKAELLRRASSARGGQGYWETELQFAQDAQNPPEAYTSPLGLAIIYSHLGDKDKAFANLEAAYSERDEEITNLAVEPQFDPLRSDPRFSDLAQRIGIPGR